MNKQRRTNYVRAIEDKIKILTMNPGDIIVFNGDKRDGHDLFNHIRDGLSSVIPDGVIFIILQDGVTLDKISPADMEKYGWYRKDAEVT